ncbi:MAG: MiaB/RimO family radical SAM methylthiotransferase [Spirochaetes bacterium]|nr:MAG: MiaB/RimO family radical SAM methylthiotransferase [Spirochaetota bacterium]
MSGTFSIKTLGCKLNQYESSKIAHDLAHAGWRSVPFGEPADLVIVNTCTVTDRSDKKCRNYIRQGAGYSHSGLALVTGCLARRDPGGLRAMPQVGALAAESHRAELWRAIREVTGEDGPVPYTAEEISAPENPCAPLPYLHTRGFLKIQDGCDGHCSYCVVPSVRGAPQSRDFGEILDHARALIDHGCPELVLTGITIGKYEHGGHDLSVLVEALCGLPGAFRVRITSIEPLHLNDRLIGLLGEGKVCPHIHLPLQSGSDRILAAMNRPYTAREYLEIITNIRKKTPEIAIGTDIIVGYPGEEDPDFDESLAMIDRAGFAYVHQFSFSARSGTPASIASGRVPAAKVRARSGAMKRAGRDAGERYRAQFMGRILSCVIEKGRGSEGYTAVSDNYIKIGLPGGAPEIARAGIAARVLVTGLTPAGATGILAPAQD